VIDPKEPADRYVAVWIEPDAERRRKHITQLWAEDGVHILEPPQQVRETAAMLGMTPTLKARGHDALQVRVTRSYQQFIAPGEFLFRARDNAACLDDVVKFNWEMVRTSDGEVAGVGLELLVLDDDGRIRMTTSSSRDEGERVLAGGPPWKNSSPPRLPGLSQPHEPRTSRSYGGHD
jgi:hypothetical protein